MYSKIDKDSITEQNMIEALLSLKDHMALDNHFLSLCSLKWYMPAVKMDYWMIFYEQWKKRCGNTHTFYTSLGRKTTDMTKFLFPVKDKKARSKWLDEQIMYLKRDL